MAVSPILLCVTGMGVKRIHLKKGKKKVIKENAKRILKGLAKFKNCIHQCCLLKFSQMDLFR